MSKPAIALLRKDLRITRILWAPMAFSYGVFLLMFMENAWVYLATGACLSFVAAATSLGIDDRYQTEPLFAALPGTRRGLVAGRYLSWGAVTVVGLGLFLGYTALIHRGFGTRAPRLASIVSVRGVSAFLVGAVLAGLVFLPLHFRFGFWRGIWIFSGAGLGLTVVVLYAASLLAPASGGGTDAASALLGPFAPAARGLRVIAWIIDRFLGKPQVVAPAAAVLACLVYLSYKMSIGFYDKRDL